MAQWPGPYTPGKASATAEINESVTASSSLSGTNTMTGGPVSTSASFSTSASYDDSAYFNSVSPDGFTMSQPNAAGAIQNGSAQSDEIDTANGTDVNGVANASFSTSVTETATSLLYNTTDTTPASGAPVYTETDWRSMTTSTSETGSYTTSPPGGTPVTPTPNNPGAYAVFNEERIDFASVTNTATVLWVATGNSSGGGESATMGYSAAADSCFTSDKTTAADAAAGNPGGSVSGSYTLTGNKFEISSMNRDGSAGSNNYGVSWTYNSNLVNSKKLTDIGTYPAGGGMTAVSTNHFDSTETDSWWIHSPGTNWAWTTTSSNSSDATYPTSGPDGLGQSPADPGPSPPQEAQNGKSMFDDIPQLIDKTLDHMGFDDTTIPGAILRGIAQGNANILNGFQDVGIGLINVGLQTGVAGQLARAAGFPIPKIPSPDWSKGLFIAESDGTHWWSKFIGGESLFALTTMGIGELANFGRGGAQITDATLLAARRGSVAFDPVHVATPWYRFLVPRYVVKPGSLRISTVGRTAEEIAATRAHEEMHIFDVVSPGRLASVFHLANRPPLPILGIYRTRYFPGTGIARYILELRGWRAGGVINPLAPLQSFKPFQLGHLTSDLVLFGGGGSGALYNIYSWLSE